MLIFGLNVKEYMKPVDVEPDVPVVVVEEVEAEHIEDNLCDPFEGWEMVEKDMPDGTTNKIQQRHMLVSKEYTYMKPNEVFISSV